MVDPPVSERCCENAVREGREALGQRSAGDEGGSQVDTGRARQREQPV